MPKVSPLKDFISGGVGGVCLVGAGHPFDTIKVRIQTMPKPAPGAAPMYTGPLDCVLKTVKLEGFFGLYKGMLAPIIGVTPMFAVCFYGYGVGKKIQQRTPDEQLNLVQIFNAGMLSGVFTTAVMVPGERIKCLLQIQTDQKQKKYAGAFDCLKQLLREGGIRSVYRGTAATVLRDVPGSGIYFAVYEGLKRKFAGPGGDPTQLSPLRVMLAGGLSGVSMWICVIPVDTLKSRLQTAPEGKYRGIRDCGIDLVRQEGITALWRGTVPVLLRAFPANAACFFGYEATLKALNYLFPNW